jgi:hypothetical protein
MHRRPVDAARRRVRAGARAAARAGQQIIKISRATIPK